MPKRTGYVKAVRAKTGSVQPKRETANARGYNYRWQKARTFFLSENPLCVACEKEGRITQAEHVDHIIPHKGDKALFWDASNWQALCASCHSKKTVKEDGGFGNEHTSRTSG